MSNTNWLGGIVILLEETGIFTLVLLQTVLSPEKLGAELAWYPWLIDVLGSDMPAHVFADVIRLSTKVTVPVLVLLVRVFFDQSIKI